MTGAHLDHLFVSPGAQGQGIGAMLLMRVLDRGFRPLTLNVFEDNGPARRFYERHGFSECERWFNEWDRAVELRYALD
jgi:ribosomal protein S18 acetylase RimI-like enzyme